MPLTAPAFGLLAALALGTPSLEPTGGDEPFPASTALAEGVSPEALAGVSRLVKSLVDDEEIVGAELLVLKNGRSILHEAYGWRDREAEVPMETGSVFCVRSMTKPLIGAAILMLVEDDLLELGDPIAKYLVAFDIDGRREITVEHLLTHTSGLPLSLLLGKNLHELEGLQAVAELGASYELDFEPGSAFTYSDQGTDTLTALIEVVTGEPAAQFVRTRLLEPLGMRDSVCVMPEDHPLRARGCSKYVGSRGEWTRFWSPADPPIFPFFLGSQALYSTLTDYAHFLEFWQRKGRVGTTRLLRPRSVRKALTPGPYPLGSPTGLPGLRCDYGYLMQLWTGPGPEGKEDDREVVAFGHTGSDGTYAWVFPEENAMVLFFTQSRFNTTGLRVEEALGNLFLGVPFNPNQAAPPFEQYLGYYAENARSRYQAIIRDGEDLALETPGRRIRQLVYAGEDRWKFRVKPGVVVEFDRAEDGEVTGFRIDDHQEFRFQPSADLPPVDEIAARVAETHHLDLLETLGPMRILSTLRMEKIDLTGEVTTRLEWPRRYRVDSAANGNFEQLAIDGEKVWYASSTQEVSELEGDRAEGMRLENTFARFGDWRDWHPVLEVIQRVHDGERDLIMVRVGDTSAPAATLYVDWNNGRLLRVENVSVIEGMGRVGQQTTFSDFRDVSGVLLPFQSSVALSNSMVGTITTTVTEAEVGVEVPEGTFQLRD